MSVGLMLVTHAGVGNALLRSAVEVLGCCPLAAETLDAPNGCDPDAVLDRALELGKTLDTGDGLLVLSDLFGSTPSNIACRLQQFHEARIIAGLNLPMLIRVLNYPSLHLDELAHKAQSGGRDGVLQCTTRID